MDPFPDDVRRFLAANIDSLEQLETLRVLGDDPARLWEAEELSKQIQSTPDATLGHLAALESRGLLKCERREGRMYCRHSPHTAEHEQQLKRLLELYAQRPVSMIRLVYEKPSDALRDFADAFKLRKKES